MDQSVLGKNKMLLKLEAAVVIHDALSQVDIGLDRFPVRVVQCGTQHGHFPVSLDLESDVLGGFREVLAIPLEGT